MYPKRLLSYQHGTNKYMVTLAIPKPLYTQSTFNLCLISENGDALLKRVGAAEIIEFDGPMIDDINSVYLSCNDKFPLKGMKIRLNGAVVFDRECDSVVGEDSTLVLQADSISDEDKAIIKAKYDDEYAALKEAILQYSFEYTVLGSITIAFVSKLSYGYAYSIGGMMGLLYIKLLENGVDSLGSTDWRSGLVNNTLVRLGALFYLSSSIVTYYKAFIDSDHALIILALIGFLTQRLAIIKTYMKK